MAMNRQLEYIQETQKNWIHLVGQNVEGIVHLLDRTSSSENLSAVPSKRATA